MPSHYGAREHPGRAEGAGRPRPSWAAEQPPPYFPVPAAQTHGEGAGGPERPERPGENDGLVRLHDLAGRPRGAGFVADHHGTVITSHEAVDGLPRLVLYAAGGRRRCVVTADAVTPLPELDLALVRSEGLGVAPLPVSGREDVARGTYVRI